MYDRKAQACERKTRFRAQRLDEDIEGLREDHVGLSRESYSVDGKQGVGKLQRLVKTLVGWWGGGPQEAPPV